MAATLVWKGGQGPADAAQHAVSWLGCRAGCAAPWLAGWLLRCCCAAGRPRGCSCSAAQHATRAGCGQAAGMGGCSASLLAQPACCCRPQMPHNGAAGWRRGAAAIPGVLSFGWLCCMRLQCNEPLAHPSPRPSRPRRRLVINIAKRYTNSGVPLSDLIPGKLACIHALLSAWCMRAPLNKRRHRCDPPPLPGFRSCQLLFCSTAFLAAHPATCSGYGGLSQVAKGPL